jgi:hypothetical protein
MQMSEYLLKNCWDFNTGKNLALATTPGFQQFWSKRKFTLSPEIQRYIEVELTEGDEPSDYRPLGAKPIVD